MNNLTKKKLEIFAHSNNWQTPHHLDMERFYIFIIEAYSNGDISLDKDDLMEAINPIHKLNEEESIKWIIQYEQGIELLRVYNQDN
ncbi:MAG: hypothetical protein PF572_06020 [Patescibacteria group bacterium]|jgi:hypothetical protein|nr:hypothetical protein [Patescibacteria group bacterium]